MPRKCHPLTTAQYKTVLRVPNLTKKDRAVLFLLMISGFRPADLQLLRADQIFTDAPLPGGVSLRLLVAKNRRGVGRQVKLELPPALVTPFAVDDLRHILREITKENMNAPFADYSARKVSHLLQLVCAYNGWPRTTSYAFRNAYMHRTKEFCRDADGVVDQNRWQRSFTLHLSDDSPDAFYGYAPWNDDSRS